MTKLVEDQKPANDKMKSYVFAGTQGQNDNNIDHAVTG